jgi:hypothetical protein
VDIQCPVTVRPKTLLLKDEGRFITKVAKTKCHRDTSIPAKAPPLSRIVYVSSCAQLNCRSKLGANFLLVYVGEGGGGASSLPTGRYLLYVGSGAPSSVLTVQCTCWNMRKHRLVYLDTLYDIYGTHASRETKQQHRWPLTEPTHLIM